jgi:hypothetical protein
MQREKRPVLVVACLALTALVVASPFFAVNVAGWSNGGYSADPTHPDYGTHDWIAEHALDWLPTVEKQWILDNKAVYLYGTELPDNNQAADGIDDTGNHHIYFSASGSLQDDTAAVRAREEYTKAVDAFNTGNLSEAAKRLGVVTHYVADMGVFGHVMGASTPWGTEQHHSDYEEYVNTRTNSYQDEFNSFLVFDGSLTASTAHDAAVTLANDTTFDAGGIFTCVWMDTYYDWTDPSFRSRAGGSLNLAVNAVADVLHTFYNEAVVPEFPSGILLAVLLSLVTAVALFVRRRQKRLT